MERIKNGYSVEYQTNQINEVKYLAEQGINWTFVYTNKFNIRTYKYKKTERLFLELFKYYRGDK